jgi:ribosomal subunit interface protein
MNLRVTVRGLTNPTDLRAYAAQRVAAALQRFRERIHRVRILLEDTGPAKPAVDRRCRVDVHLRSGDAVRIDEAGTDIYVALALAVERLKAAVSRKAGQAKRGVGAG